MRDEQDAHLRVIEEELVQRDDLVSVMRAPGGFVVGSSPAAIGALQSELDVRYGPGLIEVVADEPGIATPGYYSAS